MGKIILVIAACLVVATAETVLSDTSIWEDTQMWCNELLEGIKRQVQDAKDKAGPYYQEITKDITDCGTEMTKLETQAEKKAEIMKNLLDLYSSEKVNKCYLIPEELKTNKTTTTEYLKKLMEKKQSEVNNLNSQMDEAYQQLMSQINVAIKDQANCASKDPLNTFSDASINCVQSVCFSLYQKKDESPLFQIVKKIDYTRRIIKLRLIENTSAKVSTLKNQISTSFAKIESCIKENGLVFDVKQWTTWLAERETEVLSS